MKRRKLACLPIIMLLAACNSVATPTPAVPSATPPEPGWTPTNAPPSTPSRWPTRTLAPTKALPTWTPGPTPSPIATRVDSESALTLNVPDTILSLAWSRDGERLFIGTFGRGVWIADAVSGAVMDGGGTAAICSLAVSPDGRTLAAGFGHIAKIELIAILPGGLKRTLSQGLEGTVQHLAFDPDGKYLASAGAGKIVIWDIEAGQPIKELYQTEGLIGGLAYSPDGQSLLLASGVASEYTFRVWDTSNWRLQNTFQADKVADLALSPDGSLIATANDAVSAATLQMAGQASVWDAATGHRVVEIKQEPPLPLQAIAYSPNGLYVATAGGYRSILLWDPQTGRPLRELFAARYPFLFVSELAFSPDGTKLASAGNKELTIWDIPGP